MQPVSLSLPGMPMTRADWNALKPKSGPKAASSAAALASVGAVTSIAVGTGVVRIVPGGSGVGIPVRFHIIWG